MKFYKWKESKESDKFNTPEHVASMVIEHYLSDAEEGLDVLEPCASGEGGFEDHPLITRCAGLDYDGRLFQDCLETPDWIITNPPYSLMRQFLEHAMILGTPNIVFAPVVANKMWNNAKLWQCAWDYGYGLKEMILLPDCWPNKWTYLLKSLYFVKDYKGGLNFLDFRGYNRQGNKNRAHIEIPPRHNVQEQFDHKWWYPKDKK